jgi:hypothetical protein
MLTEGAGKNGLGLQQLLGREFLQVLDQQGEFDGMAVVLAEQFGQRGFQRARYLAQEQDGNIALSAFQLGKIALGDAGFPGQRLARKAKAGAGIADPGAQLLQIASGFIG